jgi:hypothetical protein
MARGIDSRFPGDRPHPRGQTATALEVDPRSQPSTDIALGIWDRIDEEIQLCTDAPEAMPQRLPEVDPQANRAPAAALRVRGFSLGGQRLPGLLDSGLQFAQCLLGS